MPNGGTAPRRIWGVPPYRRQRHSSARLVREPAAVLCRGKKFRQRGVDRIRLLAGDGVTGARNDQQTRRRCGALEKDAAVEAGLVLVADNDEKRRREFLQVRFHVPQS